MRTGLSTRTGISFSKSPGIKLNFDEQTGSFSPGGITGAMSGATATVLEEIGGETLTLTGVSGTFEDNEIIYRSGLGAEAITAQNDRDFNTNIGNWTVVKNGSGTLAWNEDLIGGADNKQALLTCDGDAYLYAMIDQDDFSVSANTFYKATTNVYVPAGNTLKDVRIRTVTFDVEYDSKYSPTDNTQTSVEFYFHVAADITGGFRVGFYGDPTNGDKLYFDDISIKPITNAALANGTVY